MDQKKSKKANKEGFAQKAGDKLERLGEKISQSGLPKTGKAIYDAGNKLEHSKD